MKKYDFETAVPRYDIGAPKWLQIKRFFPEEPEGIIPFSVADMELKLAPEISEGLIKFIEKYQIGYGKPTPKYFEAVKLWMKKRHNWDIETDWIVLSKGVINAFHEVVRTYSDEGDGIIMFTPIYYPMYAAITKNNRHLVESPLINNGTQYDIDFEQFEEIAKDPKNKVLLFCSPHNPGGRVWTKEELERIGKICIENDIIIGSDEIHFDILAPGVKHTVFSTISPEIAERTIIMTAPSKTFNLAGFETSNIIISNKELREQFIKAIERTFMDVRSNLLGMEACRLAYTEGDAWVDQVLELIDHNRQLVEDFYKKEMPQITCMKLEGSYLLWMDFSKLGIEDDELNRILREEAKLFFDDGQMFGKSGEGYQRWNLACPSKYIEEGLLRLKEALSKYVDFK